MSSSPCANDTPDGDKSCNATGKLACGVCLLVSYCGKDCQKAHWAKHKVHCKSPLMKKDWSPTWEVERRNPAFVGNGLPMVSFVPTKYFWGNMPALDILQLEKNEGADHEKELAVLFAASGDFRNAVKTVACLPEKYQQPISVVLNDRDFDIVARNAIMLLVLLPHYQGSDQVLETVIHLWYSAKIPSSYLHHIQSTILPLIQDVCAKVKDKAAGTILGKTWTFGDNYLRLVLSKEHWLLLPGYLEVPNGLTCQKADTMRTASTLAPSRIDYRDRNWFLQKPSHRVCKQRFREDGIMLPFGQSRDGFDTPNPTFYQSHKYWQMNDSADPMDGWDQGNVLKTLIGPTSNDFYGKLFHHIKDLLSKFQKQTAARKVSFELLCMDVKDLPRQLNGRRFARIEVSNITDLGYVGLPKTLALLSPLLQNRAANPHVTMITLFMNAVGMATHAGPPNMTKTRAVMTKAMKYMGKVHPPTSAYDPHVFRHAAAGDLLRDNDRHFNEYMREMNFVSVGQSAGMLMKKKHTIVEKWPLGLKLKFGQAGAKEEFETLLAAPHSGYERYVEWAWA